MPTLCRGAMCFPLIDVIFVTISKKKKEKRGAQMCSAAVHRKNMLNRALLFGVLQNVMI